MSSTTAPATGLCFFDWLFGSGLWFRRNSLVVPSRLRSDEQHSFGNQEMPRKSIAERLAQIEEQRRALKARLSKQERARDTRRKVLLGAFLLHQLDAAGPLAALLNRELPGFLQRRKNGSDIRTR